MPNTLDINEIRKPDGLATAISEKYITWESSKSKWYSNVQETLEYLYATSTRDIYNQPRDFDNSTHIAKLTQIRDMLITYYLDAMFSLPDFIEWIPYNDSTASADIRNSLNSIIKQTLDDTDFKGTIRKVVEDYVDYGNAFITAVPYTKIVNGKVIYSGPKAIRISPLDIFFDPLATDFAHSPKIIRSVKTLGELVADSEQSDVLKKALDKRKEIRDTIYASNKDTIINDMCNIAGFDSWSSYYASDTVELLTFYGDLYDIDNDKFYKNAKIVVMDRCSVLVNEPNETYDFISSIFKAGWRDRKDNLWSMSPLDNLKGLQFMIDFLENKRADIFNFISNPVIVTKGDVEMPEYLYPGCHFGIDADCEVRYLTPDATALQADLYIDRYMNLMEEMAGTPKEAMGFRTPGEKTAFEVSQLNTASSRLFNEKVSKFETELLEPLLTLMIKMILAQPDKIVSIRTKNQYGASVFTDLDISTINAEGRFQAIGSATYTEKAKIAQTLLQLSNTAFMNDQLIGNWFDPKKLAEIIVYVSGLDKINGLLKENARVDAEYSLKTAANAATELLEEEQVRGVRNAQQADV